VILVNDIIFNLISVYSHIYAWIQLKAITSTPNNLFGTKIKNWMDTWRKIGLQLKSN